MKKIILLILLSFSSSLYTMENDENMFTLSLENLKLNITKQDIVGKVTDHDGDELSLLQYAIKYDHKNFILFFLEQFDLKLYKGDSGESLFHEATEYYNLPMIKLLLEKDGNPNEVDNNNENALHVCFTSNQYDKKTPELRYSILDILIEHGADITNEENETVRKNRTMAIDRCYFDVLKIYKTTENYHLLLYKGIKYIIQNGLKERAQRLMKAHNLSAKAFHIVDKKGNNLLHVAVLHNNKPRRLTMTSYLIHHGIDMNAQNSDGNTPLHLAAANGYWRLVGHLLSKGADMFIENNAEQTVFGQIVKHKDTQQELLKKIIDKFHKVT